MMHPSIFFSITYSNFVRRAHTHLSKELRDRTKAEREYNQGQWKSVLQQPLLAAFLSDAASERKTLWRDVPMQTVSACLELSGSQFFLLHRSYEIQSNSLEEGLGCVTKRCQAGRKERFVKVLYVEAIIAGGRSSAGVAVKPFVLEEHHHIDREFASIGELIQRGEGLRSFCSESALIESKALIYGVQSS
jgi:hypothetical protein